MHRFCLTVVILAAAFTAVGQGVDVFKLFQGDRRHNRPPRRDRRPQQVFERGYTSSPAPVTAASAPVTNQAPAKAAPVTAMPTNAAPVAAVGSGTWAISTVVERLVTNVVEKVKVVEKPITNVVEKLTVVEKPVTNLVEKFTVVEKPVTNVVERVIETQVTNLVETVKVVEKPVAVTNVIEKVKVVEKPVTVTVTNVIEKVTVVEKPVTNVVEKVKIVERQVTNIVEKTVSDRTEELRLKSRTEELQLKSARLESRNDDLEQANDELRRKLASEQDRVRRLERVVPKAAAMKTGRPARILSETSFLDRKAGIVCFNGKVWVDDEQYQMHADEAYVFMSGTNDVRRIVALGNVALTNEARRAYGTKASYYREGGMVVLYGTDKEPAIVRDESKAEDQTLRGRKIKFWIDSEQVEVIDADISAPTSGMSGGDALKALRR